MWKNRDIVRGGFAILGIIAGWVLIRLAYPPLDYSPREGLLRDLGPSWFSSVGIRQFVKVGYITAALIYMAVFVRSRVWSYPNGSPVRKLL